ncbi:hypothetical protein CFP56_038990 [Quercus suber]|uniref:Uncharacterized protein n=1 Tax=Quercus suber TaxID=58331 RepID=A0AAW0J0T8_QUESU
MGLNIYVVPTRLKEAVEEDDLQEMESTYWPSSYSWWHCWCCDYWISQMINPSHLSWKRNDGLWVQNLFLKPEQKKPDGAEANK